MNFELPREAPDVLVVGAGNAALCAAISAHENGARVLMLEAASFEERGGNSHFTGGAFRFAFRGVDDLISVLPSLAQENLENVDFGTYTEDEFFDDLFALTQYRSDPDLAEILVRSSRDTAAWAVRQGVKLQPGLGRQAYKVDGKFKFWGGLALHIWGGGPELLKALYANVERRGIPILYETPAVSLIREHGRVVGVMAEVPRRAGRDPRRRRGARLRQLRVQSGDARALSRAGLGAREDTRHAIQHGRRPRHGDAHRRAALRQLVRLSFGRLGRQRAALWRPHGRRPVPEAQLSVRHHRQRQGRALCRRGPELP